MFYQSRAATRRFHCDGAFSGMMDESWKSVIWNGRGSEHTSCRARADRIVYEIFIEVKYWGKHAPSR